MKKLFLLIILVGVLFFSYKNIPAFAAQVNNVLYRSPCEQPRTFSIGTIDSRFNISKDELIQDAETAGSIWRNSQGMALMQYDPNAKLTINMIYDQRQALNSQINNLNDKVDQQKNTLKPEISDYEKQSEAFKQKSADLNAQIAYWNNQGGAPQDVYAKLMAEQKELQTEASQLQQMADKLNQSTDQYNTQIQQLDQKVDAYNNTLQYKPEEGEYIRNGADEKIVIYFNNSRQELIHTLAHEMGHALGLEHNNNPKSIMYPRTTLATTPSADDLSALAAVCEKRSIFQTMETNFAMIVTQVSQSVSSALNHS